MTPNPRHRSNDIVSGVLHLLGTGLAIAVLVVLLVFGAMSDDVWHVVGYSLYGSGLILLYLASTLYHLTPEHWVRFKHIARRLDHAMIYVLIAATYTPITFIALTGGWRWSIFGVVWGLALLGGIVKLIPLRVPAGVSLALYLVMGWLICVAIVPLLEGLTTGEFWLLLSGGLAYTVGVIFYALERHLPQKKYFWMHEVFHIFVLGGSALHAVLMFYLL